MSVTVSINGQSYQQPTQGTPPPWGDTQATIVKALADTTLQRVGGSFPLTNDVDFGAAAGLVAEYFKSRSADIADDGVIRLARTDEILFRNEADDGNNALGCNASNQPTWNGNPIALGTGDVSGPGSATANALARFDGTTGKAIKNSLVVATDDGDVTGIKDLNASGTIAANNLAATAAVSGASLTATGALSFGTIDATNANKVGNAITRAFSLSTAALGAVGYSTDTGLVTTATTYQDAYNNIAINTNGNPVVVTLVPNNGSTFSAITLVPTASTDQLQADVALTINAAVTQVQRIGMIADAASANWVVRESFGSIQFIVPLSAGAHIIKIQMQLVTTGATLSVGASRMIAYELR